MQENTGPRYAMGKKMVGRCLWGWWGGVYGDGGEVSVGMVGRCLWGWWGGVCGDGGEVSVGMVGRCLWGWWGGVCGDGGEVSVGMVGRCLGYPNRLTLAASLHHVYD